MSTRLVTLITVGLGLGMLMPIPGPVFADSPKAAVTANGLVKVTSAYGFDETIARIKADIARKGITFFLAVDQSKLAADAGIKIGPSTLLIFGNPALGTQFMTRNPESGIDWPVRILVFQAADGTVYVEYTDFGWIARRHGIAPEGDAAAPFRMASDVIASITSSIAK